MDISDVVKLALGGSVPLMTIVLGLVEYFKKLGVAGNWLLVISMLLGLATGGGYLYLITEPTAPLGYFLVGVYGILVGLAASGVYKAASGIAQKAGGGAVR